MEFTLNVIEFPFIFQPSFSITINNYDLEQSLQQIKLLANTLNKLQEKRVSSMPHAPLIHQSNRVECRALVISLKSC